ncbi:MAG TPA: deoxynucleoside kinase [Thermoplasmata archaeon]|nr:deoxynucleoside kinase [Thermoplasmata archaeon]
MKFVNVTGAIGAGATTLTKMLATRAGWQLALESDVERRSPFLELYYRDPTRYALHNQLTFLVETIESDESIRTRHRGNETVIRDYCAFEHIEVYAECQRALGMLSPPEFALLRRIGDVIASRFIRPDLLVYRRVPLNIVLERIKERGRPSERYADARLVESVFRRFEDWVQDWTRSPKLIIDSNADFLRDGGAVDRVLDHARKVV